MRGNTTSVRKSKNHFKTLILYFYATVKANNIPVMHNTEAIVENVMTLEPDVVVCTIGVKHWKLPLPGIDLPNILSGKDYFGSVRKVEGKKVVF